MALKNPTPPTPPVIDKGDGANTHAKIDAPNLFNIPFVSDGGVNFENPATENFEPIENEVEVPEQPVEGTKKVETPETMARDAVANGAGALTKKTVTRPQENNSAPQQANQQTPQIVTPLPQDTTPALSDTERGAAVLREFEAEDRQLEQNKLTVATQTPPALKNNLNQNTGQSVLYWILILTVALVCGVIAVKKILLKDKPKLKKSDLFEDSTDRLKAATDKLKKSAPPVTEDKKVKHFEVRV